MVSNMKTILALRLVLFVCLQISVSALLTSSWNDNIHFQNGDAITNIADRRSVLSVVTGAPILANVGSGLQNNQRRGRGIINKNESKEKKGTLLILHESKHNPDRLVTDVIRTTREKGLNFLASSQESNNTRILLDLDVLAIPCEKMTPLEFSNIVDELLHRSENDNLAVVGMGFGGTLAMYSALQCLLPSSKTPSMPPVASISVNGFLDLKWGIEQGHRLADGRRLENLEWLQQPPSGDGIVARDFANRSPIDMLPPASKNLRQQAASITGSNLAPPNCFLGLVHVENNPMVAPIEHSTRFTVAACVGGIEVDYHRIKKPQQQHPAKYLAEDCFHPDSTSWEITKTILFRELARGRRTLQNIDNDQILVEAPLMKPTVRVETNKEILIQTRRAIPLYL